MDGRLELLLDPMEGFQEFKKLMLVIFGSDIRLEVRQYGRGPPIQNLKVGEPNA